MCIAVPPTSVIMTIDGVEADTVDWVEYDKKTVMCERVGGTSVSMFLIGDGKQIAAGLGSVRMSLTRTFNEKVLECRAINNAMDNPITDQTTINVLCECSNV